MVQVSVRGWREEVFPPCGRRRPRRERAGTGLMSEHGGGRRTAPPAGWRREAGTRTRKDVDFRIFFC